MKCIIVDDEPLAREGMELNVQELRFLDLQGQFANAISANTYLSNNEVDLMFLDIQMPGMTGLDFLNSLRKPPLTIITTAYPDFALQGFELDVIDYLLKPIRLERFMKAVNKAKEIHELRNVNQAAQSVDHAVEEFTYVPSERKYIKLYYKDIIFIEGLKDYVILNTAEGKVMTAMNLKTILQQLPASQFARVNKSFIVNIEFISSVDTDFIVLPGKEIPLGRTYKERFINDYIKTNLIRR